jgi:hypothetical protein
MASVLVWVQVLYAGDSKPVGESTRLKLKDDTIVDDLGKAAHAEFSIELKHWVQSGNSQTLRPRNYCSCSRRYGVYPGEEVPTDTISKKPIIVIAPKPQE